MLRPTTISSRCPEDSHVPSTLGPDIPCIPVTCYERRIPCNGAQNSLFRDAGNHRNLFRKTRWLHRIRRAPAPFGDWTLGLPC